MLYNVKQIGGLDVLTHGYSPGSEKNGFAQVGNVKNPRNQVGAGNFYTPAIYRPGLSDRFINDNPFLSDDLMPVDTGTVFGPALPAVQEDSIWGSITGAFSNVFSSAVKTTEQAGVSKVSTLIDQLINPTHGPTSTVVTQTQTNQAASQGSTLGISNKTLLLGGGLIAAVMVLRKR